MKIRKAVIAVAGYGTRFLPATKVVPKELLPIVDKPVVQYLVEEAVESGVEDVILVTRSGAGAIADHFDSSGALEAHLEQQHSDHYLKIIREIPRLANFAFVRQPRHLPYGNGTPLVAARRFIGDEPFVYMFGDDLVLAETPGVLQLIDCYNKHSPAAVVAAQKVPREETSRYGIIRLKPGSDPPQMDALVEKPKSEEAPSTLAQFGRFILPPKVIEILQSLPAGKGGELWLADAIDQLCRTDRVLVEEISGDWLTTGDPLRFLIANIEYALRHKEIGGPLAEYLARFGGRQ